MAERDVSLRLAVVNAEEAIQRLRAFGERGEDALKRIETSSQGANRGLTALNSSAQVLQASAARLVPALAAVGVGLAGLATGGILAAATGLSIGVRNSEAAEKSFLRLEGVLRATGGAAGLTTREIGALADQIERTTLANGEAVVDAASALATFRSVSGEAFTDTLRLAQDLAAVFGGNLTSQAIQLGKALEDPIQGLTALRRVGVSFTRDQREVIRSLVETGQVADAQRVILNNLERQVGGAGEAEAMGLTGAFSALKAELADLLQDFAEMTGAAGGLEAALRGVTAVAGGLRESMQADHLGDLKRVQDEISALEAELARPDPAAGLRGGALTALDQQDLKDRIAALRDLERQIGRNIAAEQGLVITARLTAQLNAEEAEAERLREQRMRVVADLTQRVAADRRQAAEEAARLAQREAERARQAIEKAGIEVDQQGRLLAALGQGEAAHREVAKAIEVENELRSAGLDAMSEEGKQLTELVKQRQALADEMARENRLREEMDRIRAEARSKLLPDGRLDRESSAGDARSLIDSLAKEEAQALATRQRALEDLIATPAVRVSPRLAATLAALREEALA